MEIRLLGEVSRLQVRKLIAPVIKNPVEEQHEGGRLDVQFLHIPSTSETLRGKSKRTALIEIHADAGSESRSAYAITKVLVENGYHVRIHWEQSHRRDEYGPGDYVPSEYES
jgi:hypothetical protein